MNLNAEMAEIMGWTPITMKDGIFYHGKTEVDSSVMLINPRYAKPGDNVLISELKFQEDIKQAMAVQKQIKKLGLEIQYVEALRALQHSDADSMQIRAMFNLIDASAEERCLAAKAAVEKAGE